MDALVKALIARGMPLRIEPDGNRRTCLTIHRIEREPTKEERQEIKKYGHTYLSDRYSYQPTGALKLGIMGHNELQKVVADGKYQRVEQFLNEFVIKLEAEAVHRKRHEEHLGNVCIGRNKHAGGASARRSSGRKWNE